MTVCSSVLMFKVPSFKCFHFVRISFVEVLGNSESFLSDISGSSEFNGLIALLLPLEGFRFWYPPGIVISENISIMEVEVGWEGRCNLFLRVQAEIVDRRIYLTFELMLELDLSRISSTDRTITSLQGSSA